MALGVAYRRSCQLHCGDIYLSLIFLLYLREVAVRAHSYTYTFFKFIWVNFKNRYGNPRVSIGGELFAQDRARPLAHLRAEGVFAF